MTVHRNSLMALVLSASLFSLTGCFGAKSATAPIDNGIDTSAPQPPSNVRMQTDAGAQRDFLLWDLSASSNVASYEVYRYDADPSTGATGTLVATMGSTEYNWAMPVVSAEVTEFYRVRALNGSDVPSAYSTTAQAQRNAWNDHGALPESGPGVQGKDLPE